MSNSSLPPHSPIPDDAPEESKKEFASIIEQLRNANTIDTESLILVLLKNILERLSKQYGKQLSYDTLTSSQRKALEGELDAIAQALEASGALGEEKNMLAYLKKMLGMDYSQKQERKQEYETLNRKAKKEYTRLLKLFIIYEIYKITNPQQLAGETELDNFINNTLTRGLDYAKKFTHRDEESLEQLIKTAGAQLTKGKFTDLEKKGDHSFLSGLAQHHKNKDTGWER